jgi:hypothetical protein
MDEYPFWRFGNRQHSRSGERRYIVVGEKCGLRTPRRAGLLAGAFFSLFLVFLARAYGLKPVPFSHDA